MTTNIDLFYFNKINTKPFVFLITKVQNSYEEKLLEEYNQDIFKILIDNKLSDDSDILVFNIIKEHESKIINWIVPSINSNKDVVKEIENNTQLLNYIITSVLNNTNCETIINFNEKNEELDIHIKDCNMNLSFITEFYF